MSSLEGGTREIEREAQGGRIERNVSIASLWWLVVWGERRKEKCREGLSCFIREGTSVKGGLHNERYREWNREAVRRTAEMQRRRRCIKSDALEQLICFFSS